MEEETEYLKLPLEDRCVHKLWKARVNGYEECTKLFAKIAEEKSPEFAKFAPLLKKFVTDSNVVAQEKALDAVLAFIENAHPSISGRAVGDVIAGIVAKCLSAPKKTTQEKALEIILVYCEVEKYEIVQEELIKGFSQKNPKVVCGCIKAVSTALREFGSKVISIKPLVKNMGALLEDRDKNVREETKKMVIEMYRWVGPALKPQLTSLKPIQIQELEAEFEKMSKEKPVQTRFLRSQQELKAKVVNQEDEQEEGEDEAEEAGDEFDLYDLVESVNILEKLPKDFYEKVEAKKWQERKEAVEALHALTQNQKLEPGDYGDLVKALKKIIGKDTNVMIIALAGQCLCGLAKGLKKKFSPYAVSCLETIFEKFKEKKINVVTSLRDASDAIFQATNIEAIQEISISALNNKNPNVKAETASFLARSFCYCTPVVLTKKLLKAYATELCKTLNESDPTVRDNSADAIGTALKVVGEKTMGPFISDIDALKMQKIKEFCDKAEIKVKIKPVKSKPVPKAAPPQKESATRPGSRPIPKTASDRPAVVKRPTSAGQLRAKKAGEVKGGGTHGSEEDPPDIVEDNASVPSTNSQSGEENDPPIHDSVSRTNISAQITSSLISELGDKNWKARMEALGKVSSLLTDAKFVEADLGELPDALCARLSDTNKNIAAEALRITSQLAASLGPQCKLHTRIIVPGIFAALGDAKKAMREQALCTLNDWVDHLGAVKEVIDGEMCIDALRTGSPFLKAELIAWLSDKLRDAPPKSLSKEELVGCVIYIYAGLEDRNVDIRKASGEAILPFMLHLGYDAMVKHSSKVKPSSKNTVMQALEKAKPNLPARPTPAAAAAKGKGSVGTTGHPGSAEKEDRVPSGAVSRGVKRVAGGRAKSGAKVGSSKKEEEADTSPLLQMNNLKQQRMTEEHRMRTLRWDFATPRPEFVTQLKDQMQTANINSQMLRNMFHQDFKFHIKALDALTENLNSDLDACIANLDLVLRWLTIRFFDTNPSVILKAMDFLSNLFSILSESNYSLIDYEAYSFLPFLVMKFGDPKDAIRGPTKNIMKLICNIYPASKVSPYILDGLKSKNARQRTGCLETMGSFIEDYGMSVCQPTPPAALKEVAKQIADRDNSVRNAALNCLLQVYFRQGEKVYKLIGQISDKDHSLLEERIKRSAKSKPLIKKPPAAETYVPAVRGAGGVGAAGGGTGSGGGGLMKSRVIPTPAAQPSPVPKDGSLPTRGSLTNENTYLKRFNQRPLSGDMGNANSRLQIDYDSIEKLLNEEPKKYQLEEIPDLDSILKNDTPCPLPTSRFSQRPLSGDMGNANSRLQIDYDSIEKLLNEEPKKYQLEEIPDMDSILKNDTPCPFPTSRLARPGFTSNMKANVANANVDLEDASQAINIVISEVASPNVNTVITALAQLDEVIRSDEKRSLLVPHIDQLLIVARFQYRHVLNTKMSDGTMNKEQCIRVYRSLTSVLMSIFHHKDLGTKASRDVLRDIMHTIISILLDARLTELEDGPRVVRALNVLAVRIIERAQFTNIFSALLKLLHESVGNSENPKFTELVMRCNWKATRILLPRCKDLNPVQILEDCHEFMTAYPSKSWADRPSDMPHRTIKTVLHHLNKAFGNDILSYLSQVPNTQGSDVKRYIMIDLNNSQKSSVSDSDGKDSNRPTTGSSNNETEAAPSRPPRKLSKSANNILSEIFRKIGSKENTKEGLAELYEFKQKNPDADIDSYLRKSSQFFQNYIERGLKKVELERQGESKVDVNPTSDGTTGSAPLSSIQVKKASRVNVDELVDQFKALAAQAGFDNTYIDSAVKEIYMD